MLSDAREERNEGGPGCKGYLECMVGKINTSTGRKAGIRIIIMFPTTENTVTHSVTEHNENLKL